MLLTDWIRWPARSHHQACRNALRGSLDLARQRRELEDAERFVEEVRRRHSDFRPHAVSHQRF
ncbi:MAG TPA: hypothetical protein VFR87_11815 [Nocardioidaceae bacterium]|nr:hypothetical protein [Nocardioidaceae bacterium]